MHVCLTAGHFRAMQGVRRPDFIDAGVWANVPSDMARREQAEIIDGLYPLLVEAFDATTFFAAGRKVAFGGVEDLLREMASALSGHGVDLVVSSVESDDDDTYEVLINGRLCTACDASIKRHVLVAATVRPMARVNELLTEADATVRVFGTSIGTDYGRLYLLDPRVPDAMHASGLFDRELPEPLDEVWLANYIGRVAAAANDDDAIMRQPRMAYELDMDAKPIRLGDGTPLIPPKYPPLRLDGVPENSEE